MKKLATILVAALMVLALSGTAQADWTLCPVEGTTGGEWDASYGGAYVVSSTDSDTGAGSVEWGHQMYYPSKCAIQRQAMIGAPLDASAYNHSGGEVGITIKIPDLTHFNAGHAKPVWLELQVDMDTTYASTQWVFDPSGIVADTWITLWAKVDDGIITGGPEGAGDLSVLRIARVCIETDQMEEIPMFARLDWIGFRNPIPDPATLTLLAFGGIGLLIRRRRKRR